MRRFINWRKAAVLAGLDERDAKRRVKGTVTVEETPTQIIRSYTGPSRNVLGSPSAHDWFKDDAAALAADGWSVSSITEAEKYGGGGRITVIYSRDPESSVR